MATPVTLRALARLRLEPSWPAWAAVEAPGYRLGVAGGWESEEYDAGSLRQEPRAGSATLRRRVTVLVPAARLADWRRMLALGPRAAWWWRDVEDGVRRRVALAAPRDGITVRYRNRGDWESEVELVGLEEDVT